MKPRLDSILKSFLKDVQDLSENQLLNLDVISKLLERNTENVAKLKRLAKN